MPQDLSAINWPLRTERLVIRPAEPDDLEATWQIRRLPSVGHWLTSAPTEREEYAARFNDPGRLATCLVHELDGRVTGDLMLVLESPWSQAEVAGQATDVQAELGWVLDPAYEKRGLATEAVREVLRACFEELGLRRVVAHCFADNTGSWRLMERLAMRREVHTVAESLHRDGRWLDGYSYALLAEEWRELKRAGRA